MGLFLLYLRKKVFSLKKRKCLPSRCCYLPILSYAQVFQAWDSFLPWKELFKKHLTRSELRLKIL